MADRGRGPSLLPLGHVRVLTASVIVGLVPTLGTGQHDGAPDGAVFEVNLADLLQLQGPELGSLSAPTIAEIRSDETVYSAATRICHAQDTLVQQQQAGCVIPLAKWLQQRSANDGRWMPRGDISQEQQAADSSGHVLHSNGWLIQLPRDTTRAIGTTIGMKPPDQPNAVTRSNAMQRDSQYRFGLRHCPPLTNRSRQLFLRAAEFPADPGKATHQGLGYFSDTDDRAWAARVALHHRQLQRQLIAAVEYPSRLPANIFFQLHYEPTWSCTLEERIGPIMDGGKWLCDPAVLRHRGSREDRCLVYSVGSEKDTLFERDIVSTYGCEVHTFDHTVDTHWIPPTYLNYHRIGLGGPDGDNDGRDMLSLPSIIDRLGHEDRVIDVFKIDCEGCEYTALLPLLDDAACSLFPPNIRQILIEVHATPQDMELAPSPFEGMVLGEATHRLLQGLMRHGFVVFHKEPNIFAMGGQFTEFSLIRLDLPELEQHEKCV